MRSNAALSVRTPTTRGRLYTPILDVVPPASSRPQPVLVAGLGERAVAVREALRNLPVELLVCEDFGAAREAIDTAKPLCLLIDVATDLGRELVLDARLGGESSQISMIGIVGDPASRETPEAFALGVDDVVAADAGAHLSLKIRDLLAGGAAPMIEAAPGVLVADPNRRRRAGVGAQMRQLGLRVRFANDHQEVSYEPGTRLVIASAWLPSLGAASCLRAFRRHPGAVSIPWVFVGTRFEVASLAAALEGEPEISYFSTEEEPKDLVAMATSLLRPPANTRRRSVRMPFSTPVRFDVDGGWSGMWGCTSDLSMGGIFVRTLTAPPVGAAVRVAFQLPTHQRLTVHGLVAWRVEPREASTHAPGFGVQFAGAMPAADHAILDAGYRRLLAITARARMALAGI